MSRRKFVQRSACAVLAAHSSSGAGTAFLPTAPKSIQNASFGSSANLAS